MNQYTQILLLRQFHNDTLNKNIVSDDYLNKWVKKYYKSNKVKSYKISCKPLQSPYIYNNGDTIYTCVQHIRGNKIEMTYWKKPKFRYDIKLPHLSPKDYPI